MYIWLLVNEDFALALLRHKNVLCILISSLQWSANTSHLATGQLVDIQHYQHPQKKFFFCGHHCMTLPLFFVYFMYLTKESSYA